MKLSKEMWGYWRTDAPIRGKTLTRMIFAVEHLERGPLARLKYRFGQWRNRKMIAFTKEILDEIIEGKIDHADIENLTDVKVARS